MHTLEQISNSYGPGSLQIEYSILALVRLRGCCHTIIAGQSAAIHVAVSAARFPAFLNRSSTVKSADWLQTASYSVQLQYKTIISIYITVRIWLDKQSKYISVINFNIINYKKRKTETNQIIKHKHNEHLKVWNIKLWLTSKSDVKLE